VIVNECCSLCEIVPGRGRVDRMNGEPTQREPLAEKPPPTATRR
jgi:hypothetical protein